MEIRRSIYIYRYFSFTHSNTSLKWVFPEIETRNWEVNYLKGDSKCTPKFFCL